MCHFLGTGHSHDGHQLGNATGTGREGPLPAFDKTVTPCNRAGERTDTGVRTGFPYPTSGLFHP